METNHFYKIFPKTEDCLDYLSEIRWPKIVACPYCKSIKVSPHQRTRRWQCNTCNTAFSVTTKTFLHRTHIDFQKWFLLIDLPPGLDKKLSIRDLAKKLKVNKSTVTRMKSILTQAKLKQDNFLERISSSVNSSEKLIPIL